MRKMHDYPLGLAILVWLTTIVLAPLILITMTQAWEAYLMIAVLSGMISIPAFVLFSILAIFIHSLKLPVVEMVVLLIIAANLLCYLTFVCIAQEWDPYMLIMWPFYLILSLSIPIWSRIPVKE